MNLDDRSSIDDIHAEVRRLHGHHLPVSYSIGYYNKRAQTFTKLNHYQLDGEQNPFRCEPYLDDHEQASSSTTLARVSLYVVVDADEHCGNTTETAVHVEEQTPVICEHVSDVTSDEWNELILTDCEEFVTSTDNNHEVTRPESALDCRENTNDNEIAQFLFEPLSMPEPSPSDESPDEPSAHTTAPEADTSLNGAMLPPHHLDLPTPYSTPQHRKRSDCPHFSRDVKAHQKDIFKSDQFNQRGRTLKNGSIRRVQGVKEAGEKMRSVWPKLWIPTIFRTQDTCALDVYIVKEQIDLEHSKRIWFIDHDRGFLPKKFNSETRSRNPITFYPIRDGLSEGTDYILDLRMVVLWNKSAIPQRLYELDEQSTLQLHEAAHLPSTPRLLCVLRGAGQSAWTFVCLSDFIRCPKNEAPKRDLSLNGIEARRSIGPSKRIRTA